MDALCSPFQKKIKFESVPTQWSHHRGGWSHVLNTLQRLQSEDGTLLISAIEEWVSDERCVTEDWVGFIHQVPRNNYVYYPDLERLIDDKYFLRSLLKCRGLFVLSQTAKDYLTNHLPVSVPIARLLYPLTPFPKEKMFDWSKFEGKVVFIGEFLRNFQAFFDLQVPNDGSLRKYLLKSQGVRFDKLRNCNMELIRLVTNDSVTVIEERLSDEEYDDWLSGSIVFLNLYDAPANTVVIECIGRGTPLVVNRLAGIEEYLGKDYPLFYDTLQEASAILSDTTKLQAATDYLKSLPIKARLTEDHFLSSLTNTSIYRSLSLPLSQQSSSQFQWYDLTVVICSYKRVYNIARLLKAFKEQDYSGKFEVILWNNNAEKQDELSTIVAQFANDMTIRLIQSSENYYCIVRLAVAQLMRSDYLLICDDDVVPHSNYISTFVSKYHQYGPRTTLCFRGHVFAPHSLDVENPQSFWEDYEHMRFFDETKPDRQVSIS